MTKPAKKPASKPVPRPLTKEDLIAARDEAIKIVRGIIGIKRFAAGFGITPDHLTNEDVTLLLERLVDWGNELYEINRRFTSSSGTELDTYVACARATNPSPIRIEGGLDGERRSYVSWHHKAYAQGYAFFMLVIPFLSELLEPSQAAAEEHGGLLPNGIDGSSIVNRHHDYSKQITSDPGVKSLLTRILNFPIDDYEADIEIESMLFVTYLQSDGARSCTIADQDNRTLTLGTPKRRAKRKNERPATFPTPKGATWHDVSIVLIRETQVRIKAKGADRTFSLEELGLLDKRTLKPNSLWSILKEFADCGHVSQAVPCRAAMPAEGDRLGSPKGNPADTLTALGRRQNAREKGMSRLQQEILRPLLGLSDNAINQTRTNGNIDWTPAFRIAYRESRF